MSQPSVSTAHPELAQTFLANKQIAIFEKEGADLSKALAALREEYARVKKGKEKQPREQKPEQKLGQKKAREGARRGHGGSNSSKTTRKRARSLNAAAGPSSPERASRRVALLPGFKPRVYFDKNRATPSRPVTRPGSTRGASAAVLKLDGEAQRTLYLSACRVLYWRNRPVM